jgi:putative transposase
MPWRETSAMDERLHLVQEYLSELCTMTELAAQYGVSRQTGYTWVGRYTSDGVLGLVDRSHRPHTSPHATAPALVDAIVAQRKRHPRWGATKLLAVVRRQQPTAGWPARSTVCDLLKARGLVEARRRARRLAPPPSTRAPITCANDVWTTDFKGEFRTGDGVYCYPLTLRDGFSRFVLRCDGLLSTAYAATRRRFERAFADFGLPARIRSDNGGPFAGPGLGRLSRLAVWWIRLGIVPERIRPGHPEQNGSHEQFHAVLKAETARPPATNLRMQQQRFRRFCLEYNTERPHEALQDQPPMTYYQPSPRVLPARVPPLAYPGHFEIRRVSSAGCIKWGGHPVFLSDVLVGEDVGFEEIDDGLWTLFFAAVPLARFDARAKQLRPLR